MLSQHPKVCLVQQKHSLCCSNSLQIEAAKSQYDVVTLALVLDLTRRVWKPPELEEWQSVLDFLKKAIDLIVLRGQW